MLNLRILSNTLLSRCNAMLTLRNRLQWLKDGDRNSKFFHGLHATRKARNLVNSMMINDTLVTDHAQIGAHVVDYYTTLFATQRPVHPILSVLYALISPVVTQDSNGFLTSFLDTAKVKQLFSSWMHRPVPPV